MAGLFGRKRGKQNGTFAENTAPRGQPPQESARSPSRQKRSQSRSRWSLRRNSHKEDDSLDGSTASTPRRKPEFISAKKKNKMPQFNSSKRQMRRSSFGSSGSISSLPESSTTTSSRRSSRYKSSRKANRKQSISYEHAEEEKKEISLHDGEEYYDSPEFRNRVAQEAADLDKEGNVYFERGDFDKAFMSYERALKLKRATLQDDPNEKNQDMLTETEAQKASILASVATSINNMTYLRQRAGQASADETMAAYLKSLQIKREILGVNHLSVGKTLNNIGSVFYLKKEFVPALKAYENAHDIMSTQLGGDHLDVGTVLSNIGDVHSALRHRREALEFYRRALDIRWTKLGRADPKVIRLLEQSAALLTGRQPKKEQDELSESEDEEFVKEDERKREEFKAECKALAQEVVADIKFFDSMERRIALEMVKQKAEFQRVLRQIASGALAENFEYYSDGSYSDYETEDYTSDEVEDNTLSEDELSVMSAPPDLDLKSDGEAEETPEVLAFLEEIGAAGKTPPRKQASGPRTPPRFQVGAKTPPSGAGATTPKLARNKAVAKTPPSASAARKRAGKPATPKTPANRGGPAGGFGTNKPNTPRTPRQKAGAKTPATSPITPASSSSGPQRKSPRDPPALPKTPGGETPQRDGASKAKIVENNPALNAASKRQTAGERLHASHRRNLTAKDRKSSQGPKRKATPLTAEERRLALMSVKDRVHSIRSKRKANGEEAFNAELAAEARREENIKPNRTNYSPEGPLKAEKGKVGQQRTSYINSTRAQQVPKA